MLLTRCPAIQACIVGHRFVWFIGPERPSERRNVMDSKCYQNYLKILHKELIPAMGCTEPIAIAFAAAKARQVLGAMPEEMVDLCSGNII